jgi:branched-chain amino acid transport system permease protein
MGAIAERTVNEEKMVHDTPTPRGRFGWVTSEEALGVLLILLSVVVPALFGSYWLHAFMLLDLFIVVAICQNLLLSDAGQVSFGQGAVFGIAAYTVGIMTGLNGYPLWLGLLGGFCAGALLGSLFALPALRVKGFYLGFVTIAAATVMPEMLNAFNDYTGGVNGIGLSAPWLTTGNFLGFSPLEFAIVGLTLLTLLIHSRLRRTRIGRRMRVAALSPETALTLGYRPGVVRSIAFLIAAIGTSLAGILYAPLVGFLSPEAFRTDLSIFFFFAVIVGGTGYLIGPIVGAAILHLIPNVLLVDLVDYRLLGYGITALVIMLLFPDGVVGTLAKYLRTRSGSEKPAAVNLAALLAQPGSVGTSAVPRGPAQELAVDIVNAHKRYGHVKAVDDVDLKVPAKSIYGLIGPNGSGKTTLLNILSGLSRLDEGSISVFGTRVEGMSAADISNAGMARTFQTPRIFEDLTAWENLQIGFDVYPNPSAHPLRSAFERIRKSLGTSRSDTLPHAQRRVLEVLRCVAKGPRLLLLDEPAAGLSKEERMRFAELLRRLRQELDLTIILVEHDLALVWQVADEITVLDAGRVVKQGSPDQVIGSPEVQKLFSGK